MVVRALPDPSPRPRGRTRIVLRPLGSGLPLGFFSFGIGMLILGCQATGWIPVSEQHEGGMLLMSFVFPLEYIRDDVRLSRPGHARRDDAGAVHDLVARARVEPARLGPRQHERHARDLPLRLRDRRPAPLVARHPRQTVLLAAPAARDGADGALGRIRGRSRRRRDPEDRRRDRHGPRRAGDVRRRCARPRGRAPARRAAALQARQGLRVVRGLRRPLERLDAEAGVRQQL